MAILRIALAILMVLALCSNIIVILLSANNYAKSNTPNRAYIGFAVGGAALGLFVLLAGIIILLASLHWNRYVASVWTFLFLLSATGLAFVSGMWSDHYYTSRNSTTNSRQRAEFALELASLFLYTLILPLWMWICSKAWAKVYYRDHKAVPGYVVNTTTNHTTTTQY